MESEKIGLLFQRLARQMKYLIFDFIRRYHTLLPSFLECYAGNLSRPGPVFARESEVFFALARLVKPNHIIEIGIGGAASTIAFGEALRLNGRGHLLSIDINEKLIQRASQIFEVHRLHSHVTFIKGNSSSEAIRQLISAQVKQVDILFIDGDHSFDGCRSDFESYRHLLSPEALVIFHDTGPFPLSASDLVAQLDLARNETPLCKFAMAQASIIDRMLQRPWIGLPKHILNIPCFRYILSRSLAVA